MENKKIGIFGSKLEDDYYGISLPYMDFLLQYGDVRIITVGNDIDTNIDLLVIPGGADVDPRRYNHIPHIYTARPDPIKEYMDTVMLPKYIEAGIPVFGICRGCQSIAVLYGASLIQHMWHETNEKDRSDTVHEIDLNEPFWSQYKSIYGACKIRVNSMHHQCISTDNFPECLEIIGMYKGKNSNLYHPEVIRHYTLPIYAVQYHPEELNYDPLSDYIINKLLKNE